MGKEKSFVLTEPTEVKVVEDWRFVTKNPVPGGMENFDAVVLVPWILHVKLSPLRK